MTQALDMNGRYAVEGYRGVAFYLLGYAEKRVPMQYLAEDPDTGEEFWADSPDEFETVEDRSFVRAVMVGDDREHIVDVDDLTPLAAGDYCPECGQVGCKAYALSEEVEA